MELLFVLFGGIWILYKWIKEESQISAAKLARNRIDAEIDALYPDKQVEAEVRSYVNDCKYEALMDCKEQLLHIYDECSFNNAIRASMWSQSPIHRQIVIALLLARKGMYDGRLPVACGDGTNLTGTSIIEFYHQLEITLHRAGKRNVRFYLKRLTFPGSKRPEFQGVVSWGDQFVLETAARFQDGCIRIW